MKNCTQLILSNKESLISKLSEWVKETYPTRTQDLYKCNRDINFVIHALTSSLTQNNTIPLDHVLDIFYKGGKLQLTSTEVEVAVYNKLIVEIEMLLKDNLVNDIYIATCKEYLNYFIEKLQTGHDTLLPMWTERRNYHIFDTSVSIPTELERRIDVALQNTPLQYTGMTNFMLLKLTEADLEIKEFLLKHRFYNSFNLHMVAMCTAPLVYLAVMPTVENDDITESDLINRTLMQIGIHGGVALAETLHYGFDFSFIGCTQDVTSKQISKTWKKMVKERWGFDAMKTHPWPLLCCCIGKGVVDNAEPNNLGYIKHILSDGTIVSYQTLKEKHNHRKNNIIMV